MHIVNSKANSLKEKHKCISNTGHQFDEILDMHSIINKQENTNPVKKATAELVTQNLQANTIGAWLPLAAEHYCISPKLEDYICVPVVIMPSDLPNRNGVAFPYSELTAFNPNPYVKKVAYQTWEAAPTFYEHNNSDYTKAKGVVFSVTIAPIKGSQGNLYKVITLCGFDRTKDSKLYDRIKSKSLSTYSMGSYCDSYHCSICGKSYDEGACSHFNINNPQFKTFDTKYGPKLAYYEASGICGFEVSAVETPAYVSAQNEYLLSLD